MRTVWRGRAARAGIGLAAVAAGAIAWWLGRRDAAALVPIATDAAIERALAGEATRAQREGPSVAPEVLSPEGLATLAEHWKGASSPEPAVRHRPRALERAAPERSRSARTPGVQRSQIERERPQRTSGRARFQSSVRALVASPTP